MQQLHLDNSKGVRFLQPKTRYVQIVVYLPNIVLSKQTIHQWKAYLFSFWMIYKSQFQEMYPHEWFCGPGFCSIQVYSSSPCFSDSFNLGFARLSWWHMFSWHLSQLPCGVALALDAALLWRTACNHNSTTVVCRWFLNSTFTDCPGPHTHYGNSRQESMCSML